MSSRVFRRIGLGAVTVVLLVLLWYSRRVILLLFAGLLIALILTSFTNLLRKVLPVGHKPAFGIILLLLVGLIWGTSVLIAPAVADQFSQLAEQVPKLLDEARQKIESSSFYQKIEGVLPNAQEMVPSGGMSKITKIFSSTFEAASAFVFITFTAIFLAASPKLYRGILIKLTPPRHRKDAEETTDRAICTLKYWLLGQAVSMATVGVITGVALAIAGIPFATAIGLIAGFAEFIPILGPIIASIPALLLALSEGGDKFLIVLAIFVGIQFLEGNIIMPIVQRKAVDLPPVITLLALFLLGSSFGLLGMFVAAPFAALVMVLVEDLYLQKYLKTEEKLLA